MARSLMWRPLLVVLATALAGCTHYAGVFRKYESEAPVAGTEEITGDAGIQVEFKADVMGVAGSGTLRGSVTAKVAGTVAYEVSAHVVEAKDDYDLAEAIVWRTIAVPFHLVFLGPIFGSGCDYGDDGAVGFGDRVLNTVHALNPLMAWPLGSHSAGEDQIVTTRSERRPTDVVVQPDVQLVLTSRRGSVTLPVPLNAEGKFEINLLGALEQVWDTDLLGELRESKSQRVLVLPSLTNRAGEYLASIGRRVPIEWAITRAMDTRTAYADFLMRHRDSPFASEVIELLHDIDWREAQQTDDRQAYATFLQKRPGSPRCVEARIRIEELDWQHAAQVDTIASYTQFLAQTPDGARSAAARNRLIELQTVRDWEDTQRRDTVTAYRDFMANHPEGPAAATARTRLAELEMHAAEWLAVCAIGTAQGFRDYKAKNPQGPYARAADRALLDLEGRDIVDLLEEGKVEVKTAGGSIQSISVEVRRLVPYPLRVRIPVGSYFVSARQSAQNMVATRPAVLDLSTDEWRHAVVGSACANQPKDIPGNQDSFTIRRPQHLAELERLMQVLDEAKADYPTRQAAVWIVTDDTSYGQLGTLVSRSVNSSFGGTRIIGALETAKAIRLCADAGIAIDGKRILADRDTFLPSLPDGDLKSWLAAQVEAPRKR